MVALRGYHEAFKSYDTAIKEGDVMIHSSNTTHATFIELLRLLQSQPRHL